MATYTELRNLWNDSAMRNKVGVAITVAAESVRAGTDTGSDFDQSAGAHDARFAWIKNHDTFNPSETLISTFWQAMLAANKGSSVATITGAGDTTIQTNVNKVVDVLARGES